MVEIDMRRIDPQRARKVERHETHDAREHRREVQSLLDVRTDGVVGILPPAQRSKDHEAADVHRRLGRLQLQEEGVQRAEVLHGGAQFTVIE